EWVHVQLHQQKGMISLSPPTICNSAINPVCRICITVPDERKTYVAVKKPTLLPALVIAVK
ncbi:hypothetical protein ACNITS_23910, partial [Escherichia coli]